MQTPLQPDPRPDQSPAPSQAPATPPAAPAYPATPPQNPTGTPKPTRPGLQLPAWTGWAVGGLIVVGIAVFFLFFWRGELWVTATPPTATVSVGEVRGVGALTETVVPGQYTVRAEAPGFIPYQREFSIARNETKEVPVSLRPLPEPTKLADAVVQF